MTNKPNQAPSAWYKPGEAALKLGVTTKTVSRMADTGRIHAITLPSGHRRYAVADVNALADSVAA